MARVPHCKICKCEIDKSTAKKIGSSYICPDCVADQEKKPKSDYVLLTDYISELYGGSDKVNFPLIATQIKYYVETYNMKYSGILLALKYYIEIEGNMFNTDFFLGQAVPKYYEIAKQHFIKVRQLEKEARDIEINDKVKIVKVNIDNGRKLRYNVKGIDNIM